MMERWFFTMGDRNVIMRAQFEADDGAVGDACDVVEPGEMFLGFSYDELKDAAPGPPAGVDPGIIEHPPAGGSLRVIPPPGSPGGDQAIRPKIVEGCPVCLRD